MRAKWPDLRPPAGRLCDTVADERGATLVILSLLLVTIMGVVGFAIDLGWLYWNSVEIQHGADAAALAGVVYVATDATRAELEGKAAAAENGYIDASLGGPDIVQMIDAFDDPTAVENNSQLRARVTHIVPTFFVKIFGINTVNITRTAVAEYVLPLPLGSPNSYFGNDPALGRWPNFWGNIHGYYTGKGMGDRYASQCFAWESLIPCEKNDERRLSRNAGTQDATGGYLYAVEVDDGSIGSTLSVELFDPEFTRGGGDDYLTGDAEQDDSPGPLTTFMLYGPDPTPLDTVGGGNELLCSVTYDPRDPYADFNGDGVTDEADDQDGDGDLDFDDVDVAYPGGVAALWEPFCTVPIAKSGVYPLRIMVDDPGTLDQRGLNRWSLRAFTSGGPEPRVYGLGDMAIYANVDGKKGDTEFYLTEVLPVHAGKTLVIQLFDPGDAKGKHSVEIIDPNGNNPPCTWSANESGKGGKDSGDESACNIATSKSGGGGKFNNWLLTIRIQLPEDYTCGADCWWRVRYNYPDQTSDTTTWSAFIEGNPLRLVE
jgi:Putative Flp pilus-assembly TadE/G-like